MYAFTLDLLVNQIINIYSINFLSTTDCQQQTSIFLCVLDTQTNNSKNG